jgi:hypothetical protein
MNNPETLATLGTQDTGRRQKQSKNKTLKHNTETKEVEQKKITGELRCSRWVRSSCFLLETCSGTHIYMYCIMCTECKQNIYVGQTGDKFYQRMLLNFSNIRTQKVEDPVAKHFCQKNHCVKNFKVIGIEKTGNGDKIYRETKESLWRKLNLKLLSR